MKLNAFTGFDIVHMERVGKVIDYQTEQATHDGCDRSDEYESSNQATYCMPCLFLTPWLAV